MRETKTVTTYFCDGRHGSKRVEAVAGFSFELDGDKGQVDVCPDHLKELRKLLRPFLPANGKRSSKRSKSASTGDVAAIRQWAKDNGYEVSERGRIAQAVREAYAAAQ